MSEDLFDIVILGGGSGGYACALRAVATGQEGRPDRRGTTSGAHVCTAVHPTKRYRTLQKPLT